MRLTWTQKAGLVDGSPERWLGCREVGTAGNTMVALKDRGLAEVQVERGSRRFLYRLTPAGVAVKAKVADAVAARRIRPTATEAWEARFARETRPAEHAPIRVRCTHCGAEYPDGTPGGSCHACGLTVEAVA